MILFLTYHKVLRDTQSEPEFYTVSSQQFEKHLDMLAHAGLRAMSIKELTEEENSSDSKFSTGTKQPVPFLLSFDDGTLDHYEVVLPILAKAKRSASFFVPTSKLNRPGYLTSAMVHDMAQKGHTIGLHGHEHRRLDELGDEDIRVQMDASRKILADLTGASPVVFAPPGGFMNQRVQTLAGEAGVRAIRTMRWGYNRRVDLMALQCIPLNCSSDEKQFQQLLELRSQAAAYAMKQIARALMPKPIYERVRKAKVRRGES